MTTNYYDDDEDDFQQESEDKGLQQVRKVNRAYEKRIKELESELGNLKSQTRQRTVKDVLEAKGLNPKIAAFIPQDIESTEDSIVKWVNEYGDVFGIAQSNTEQRQEVPQEVAAQSRINNMVATGQAPDVDSSVMNKVMNAKSKDELNALLGF